MKFDYYINDKSLLGFFCFEISPKNERLDNKLLNYFYLYRRLSFFLFPYKLSDYKFAYDSGWYDGQLISIYLGPLSIHGY